MENDWTRKSRSEQNIPPRLLKVYLCRGSFAASPTADGAHYSAASSIRADDIKILESLLDFTGAHVALFRNTETHILNDIVWTIDQAFGWCLEECGRLQHASRSDSENAEAETRIRYTIHQYYSTDGSIPVSVVIETVRLSNCPTTSFATYG